MNRCFYNVQNIILVVLLLLGSWGTGLSQVVITAEDIPSATGITKEYFTNTSGTVPVDVGPTGGPQQWDFTQGPTDDSIVEQIVEKGDTPFGDLFPGANLVYDTNGLNIAGIDTASGYQYMILDNLTLSLLGAGSANVLGVPLALALDSALTMVSLPLEYGSTWSDENRYVGIFEDLVENPSPNPFFPDPYLDVKVELEMSTTGDVDAWGTVDVPYGAFDALRVRHATRTTVDIAVFLGFLWASVFDSTLVVITYDWYVRDLGSVLIVTSRPDESDPQFSEASRVRRLFRSNAINRPPVITSYSTATAFEDRLFSYTAGATDPDGYAVSVSFTDYPGWMSPSDTVISGVPHEGATDTSFTVIAGDGILFDSLTVQVTVIDVNDPPAIVGMPDTSFVSGDTVWLNLDRYVEDVDSPDSVLSWTAVSFHDSLLVNIEERRAGLTAPDFEGSAMIQFTVTDDSLASDSDSIRVTVFDRPNRSPHIFSEAQAIAREDEFFAYMARVSDPDGDVVSVGFADYPGWLSPADSILSGTPGEGTTDTSFMVIATDGFLFDSLVVSVTVIDVNDPPSIASMPDTSFISGDTLSLNLDRYVEDVDSPDSILTWTAVSFNESLFVSIENRRAVLTAPDYEGSTMIRFTVTDDSLASDSDTIAVTVLGRPNRPPRILSGTLAGAREDEPFLYAARAIDPDGDSVSFGFSGYPGWLSPSDSILSGTPIEGTLDTSFMVTATDGFLWDSLLVQVTVLAINDPPVLRPLPDTSFTSDDTLMLHLELYVEDVDTPDSLLIWSAVPSTESLLVEIEAGLARLAAPDFEGPAWVLFSVTDDSLASDADTLFVTVRGPTGVSWTEGIDLPFRFSLSQNRPNPFNPVTEIRYQIPGGGYPAPAVLKIYNLLGQDIRTLVTEIQEPGSYTVTWNGTDYNGDDVPSGIYFSVLSYTHMIAVRKMILVR